MNDDDFPIRAELASAYLDGENDGEARAMAENDAKTMAVIESFSEVRALLNDLTPVVDSTRTAAVAAALAEYDVLHASATSPSAANASIKSLDAHRPDAQRRVRSYRLLTGVAAAAVIGVIGLAIANTTGSDSGTSAPTALPAPKTQIDASAAASAATLPAAETAAPSDRIAGATEQLAVISTPEELAAFAANLTLASSQAPTTTMVVEATTAAPASTPAASGDVATVYDSDATPCVPPGLEFLGFVSYQGIESIVVRDPGSGVVQARAVQDCRVVGTATP